MLRPALKWDGRVAFWRLLCYSIFHVDQEKKGVGNQKGAQTRERHGVSRGSNCYAHQANRRACITFEKAREGSPFSPRPSPDGCRPSHTSLLFEEKERETLRRDSQRARIENKIIFTITRGYRMKCVAYGFVRKLCAISRSFCFPLATLLFCYIVIDGFRIFSAEYRTQVSANLLARFWSDTEVDGR